MSILFYSQSDSAESDHSLFDLLQRALPGHQLQQWPNCSEPESVDYAIVWGPPENFFDGLVNLKAILSIAAGVDHLLNHPGLPAGVPIVRLTDAGMANKIAEYTLYGVLRAQRGFHRYEQLQAAQRWQPLEDIHAADFAVGVMGLGAIGNPVAERLHQAGYRVSGWRRSATQVANVRCYHSDQQLDDFLAELNVLVCLLPLTNTTQNIIDARLLQKLPVGSHFINAARGGHVVEADLIEALDSGRLHSALLDVCQPEPPPPEHPFWNHPGITLTPHVAGPTQQGESVEQIVQSIKALESGQRPAGLVDTDAGY